MTFWDELAHSSFQHVEKGHQIYVLGRLVIDIVESEDGKQQIYYQRQVPIYTFLPVIVQQLNFVVRSLSSSPLYDHDSDSMTAGKKLGNIAASNVGSVKELWQPFFANPVDWWDNGKNKKNPKYPDFKHKDTGEALWSQLAILDTQMGSLYDQDARIDANIVAGDKILPF
ncbi:hypothetical protein I3842_03G245900 [Carya illinoinensis]|uniref:Uncharacterized protein n=1 Tax=Carya illinoinensis TaxID=32201 RepID=A0A922FPH6_CARIL|nr:hypothetical protein I3842_03G245900 [Carya illinoinensis]